MSLTSLPLRQNIIGHSWPDLLWIFTEYIHPVRVQPE